MLVLAAAALALLAGIGAGGFALLRGIFAVVIEIQRQLYGELAAAVDALKSRTSAWPLAALLGISFLYGIFHAVGPGHGKVVISSYLVASASRFRRGLLLSFAAAMVQALSAVLVVGLLAVAMRLTRFEINSRSLLLEEGSYGLVVLVGIAMLVSILWRGAGAGHASHGGHHHAHHLERGDPAQAGGKRRHGLAGPVAVVLATGIRPCSGAILVLLFALAQGVFALGVAAAFVMALGTGLTISGLALLAVFSRRAALRLAEENSPWQARIHTVLAVASSLLVIGTGLIFLLATANQSSSL
jgi:ABC-type nickel/cobalt efflux system permease component RcnA